MCVGLLRGLAGDSDRGDAVLVDDLLHGDWVNVDLGAVWELFVKSGQFVRLGASVLEREDDVDEVDFLSVDHDIIVADYRRCDVLFFRVGEFLFLSGGGPGILELHAIVTEKWHCCLDFDLPDEFKRRYHQNDLIFKLCQ